MRKFAASLLLTLSLGACSAPQLTISYLDGKNLEVLILNEDVAFRTIGEDCYWVHRTQLSKIDSRKRPLWLRTTYYDNKCDGYTDSMRKEVYTLKEIPPELLVALKEIPPELLVESIDLFDVDRSDLAVKIRESKEYGSLADLYEALDLNTELHYGAALIADILIEFNEWDKKAKKIMDEYEFKEGLEYLKKNNE